MYSKKLSFMTSAHKSSARNLIMCKRGKF